MPDSVGYVEAHVTVVQLEHVVDISRDPPGRSVDRGELGRAHRRQLSGQKVLLKAAGQAHFLIQLREVLVQTTSHPLRVRQLAVHLAKDRTVAGNRADPAPQLLGGYFRSNGLRQGAPRAGFVGLAGANHDGPDLHRIELTDQSAQAL